MKSSRKREIESDSESDVDSLTEDLDQIGKLNLHLPTSFNFSYLNDVLTFPNLPSFDLSNVHEFSKDLSNNLMSYISNQDGIKGDKEEVVNSLKTAIATRIQMNKLLNDLNLGLGISTAIERLQPIKDLVHDAILLPAEDISDFEDNYEIEEATEPVGVNEIVNREQPFFSEIVKPETSGITSRILSVEQDDTDTAWSEFEGIEDISIEEARSLTNMDSLDDFFKEELLREKIQKIRKHKKLNQQLKNILVTRLMMGNYYKHINNRLKDDKIKILPDLKENRLFLNPLSYKSEESFVEEDLEKNIDDKSDSEEVALTEEDQTPTYNDPPHNSVLGCQHYQRNCKVECPECFRWFTCRFCHDNEITSHKLIRSEVKHILCMKCNTPQVPDNNYCIECEAELANYFCPICVLYDNDPTKDIYHCDKCGICRLGLGLGKDYFHCDECNICLSIDLRERHKCLSNTTHCNCPICNEYLFTSIDKVVFMKCGHSIHQICYDELCKHSYKCPICKKTVVNVEPQFRILDQEILQLPLPPPYDTWRCIISCNDCNGKSNVPYHVLGLKCKYCKSYNTNNLRLIKPLEEKKEEEKEDEKELDINRFRLIATNILSNFRIDDQIIDDPAYDADNNSKSKNISDINDDDSDDGDNENENIINLRKLTNSIVNNLPKSKEAQSNISFIPSVLQNLINNATTSKATKSKPESV